MKVTRESIATFYSLHKSKGKAYTYEHFKNSKSKAQIYDVMKSFDETGNVHESSIRKPGSGRINLANENGLDSLL